MRKTTNILNKLSKAVQPKEKEAVHNIWMAKARDYAHKAFDTALARFTAKYPRTMDCPTKLHKSVLASYVFPEEDWVSIRTTNPTELVLATVRLRTDKTRNCGSNKITLAIAYKLLQPAQKC